jgi:hypothetical protein
VHRAPGIPHALYLSGRRLIANLGRIAPRECEAVSAFAVIASEAKQSMRQQKERMDCFAALAMTILQSLAV